MVHKLLIDEQAIGWGNANALSGMIFVLTSLFLLVPSFAYGETVEFLTEDGQEELVSVFISTNKESYLVGDDFEFTLTIDDPWQGEYSFWGTDPNNDHIGFFNYNIKSSDGNGSTEYDIYPQGDGITFQYDSGTSTVKIENFWTEDLPSGEYFIHFQLPNGVSVDRYVSFEKELVPKLPEWIRNTFVWYAEGVVSETELLNSIKFLVENEIIGVQNNQDSQLQEKIKTLSQKINSLLTEKNVLNNKIKYLEGEDTNFDESKEALLYEINQLKLKINSLENENGKLRNDLNQKISSSQTTTPQTTTPTTSKGSISGVTCKKDSIPFMGNFVIVSGKYTNGDKGYQYVAFTLALLDSNENVLATGVAMVSDIEPHETKIFSGEIIHEGGFYSCHVETDLKFP